MDQGSGGGIDLTPGGAGPLLTAEDLASRLGLGVRSVVRLAAEGVLPGLKLGNHWRFRGDLVEGWLEGRMLRNAGLPLPEGDEDAREWSLLDHLPEEGIVSHLQALERVGVIRELSGRAFQAGFVSDTLGLAGALLEREKALPTAVEGGLALLHTRRRDAVPPRRAFILLGRSRDGIDFGAPDGGRTHLFFVLGLRSDQRHKAAMARLANLFRGTSLKDRILEAEDAREIRNLLGFAEARLLQSASEPALHTA